MDVGAYHVLSIQVNQVGKTNIRTDIPYFNKIILTDKKRYEGSHASDIH